MTNSLKLPRIKFAEQKKKEKIINVMVGLISFFSLTTIPLISASSAEAKKVTVAEVDLSCGINKTIQFDSRSGNFNVTTKCPSMAEPMKVFIDATPRDVDVEYESRPEGSGRKVTFFTNQLNGRLKVKWTH